MNKRIAFLGICISFCFIAKGQGTDSLKLYLTEYQRVAFVTPDSVYNFLLFIEPNGNFYFRNGTDSTYNDAGTIIRFKKDEVTSRYDLNFKSHTDKIDTIFSYYPIDTKEEDKTQQKNITDELKGSYILNQLGEPELLNCKQTVLRLVYPCEELNHSNYYHVFTIRFFEESAIMYIISSHSVDNNGIQIIHKDSSLLKKEDIKRINKHLNKISTIENIKCREPGNPWLMEHHKNTDNKCFVISNYCLRGKKSLNPIVKVCYSILGISKNHFNIDCYDN